MKMEQAGRGADPCIEVGATTHSPPETSEEMRCDGSGAVHTGECRDAMSGPTCSNPSCPPCQTPEIDTCRGCPNCVSPVSGVELIAQERERQVSVEGWTPEHDDTHAYGQLAKAAACYAIHANGGTISELDWPWQGEWWKPGAPIRDLVKAGALIAAEIDRLQRISEGGPSSD